MASLVPPIGPADAKVVLIGEAPGATEVRVGQPFVGKAGQLLQKMCSKAGIIWDYTYRTNVIKERPPDNDIRHFINLSRKYPSITYEAKMYIQGLKDELSRLNPNIIITLGNVPTFVLTEKCTKTTGRINKWRGSIIQDYAGRKVLATNHPAAALRQWNLKHLIEFDLLRAAEEQHTPEMPDLGHEYIIRPSFKDCIAFLDRCLQAPRVAFDIETTKQKELSCISFAYDDKTAISIPFTIYGKPYFTLPQEMEIWRWIAKLLEHPQIEKIAHNAVFDVGFLYARYGIRTTQCHCTMIAQGLILPDHSKKDAMGRVKKEGIFRKGLDFCTTLYTKVPYYKSESKEDGFFSRSDEELWVYNARDSIVLHTILDQQLIDLERLGIMNTYLSQKELIDPLVFMKTFGLRIQSEDLAGKSLDAEADLVRLVKEIQRIVGWEINPNSTQQMQEYFYGTLGLPPYKKRKSDGTYGVTLDEKALKRLARKSAPGAAELLEYRGLKTLKSRYYDIGLSKDGRLRSSFNPIGTTTLRLSSSKIDRRTGEGGNIQNLPPAMKARVIPEDGYLGIEIDGSQAENRVVAWIAPEPKMMAAFEEGRDIHSLTASFIFDKSPEEIADLYHEWYDLGNPIDPKYCAPIGQGKKPWRYWGKEANHAFNYGLYWKSAALRWEIPEKQARFIYERYHSAYPGVRKMHRWIEEELRDGRTVSNLFGYNCRFFGPWGDVKKKAYAFVAQSTVGEWVNRRALKFLYYRQDLFSSCILTNQVHDSIWFQVDLSLPFSEVATIINHVVDSMEQPLTFRGRSFIIPAEVTLHPKNFRDGIELGKGTVTGEQLRKALNPVEVLV